ncbi:hypothetical protein BABINDRAFT_31547 [Babjeviella inositovora NRRL Y-12698]|uniref:Small nuclear ribonucleoprotein G n=1 Tax=Babjeviella inositovora NRRL Y-12698 TaxID=984486 RepID=A0A1E3QZX8_9ASCO|nr:uncharacterized protein BABINDRAFT_31547 [Babjeviella inositovora NRRL Y-12698]ODQ82632.1 hypothetical protein BABINDRAFT_31547 [Babjeviella inositovora NRRL Y-12698]
MVLSTPELKKYMDKKLSVSINGSRLIIGTLRGYDVFLNLTLSECVQVIPAPKGKTEGEDSKEEQLQIGTVVVRGNSIVSVEALEKI